MLNKILSLLQIHALALLTFAVAFFFWKDYFTHPHQKLEKEKLAHITGTLSQAGKTMSLPSGYSTGVYLIIKEASTTFNPAGIRYSDFTDEVPEGAQITMSYNPQQNPHITGEAIQAFSLKYNNKEYITDADNVTGYNNSIDKKRNTAIYTTIGAFLAIIVVEVIRKFLK